MENRYQNILQEFNSDILAVAPANQALRLIMALEFKKFFADGQKVLEIGSGEGDSARDVLARTTAKLDLLDASPSMIELSQKILSQYKDRTTYICEDALAYLERAPAYDHILSTWTIHNFVWEDKRKLFGAIANNLAPQGRFFLLDKVYPAAGAQALLDIQQRRYKYLPKEVADAICEHELIDFTDPYRMDEQATIDALKSAGFSEVELVDRIERDILLVAKK